MHYSEITFEQGFRRYKVYQGGYKSPDGNVKLWFVKGKPHVLVEMQFKNGNKLYEANLIPILEEMRQDIANNAGSDS